MKIPEEQINGIDTIQGLAHLPPEKIPLPFKVEYQQTLLQQEWNPRYIAILPFCIVCKEPLVWHRYPEGEVIFHCPTCRREWIKGEGWPL